MIAQAMVRFPDDYTIELVDIEDLLAGVTTLSDPADPVLDWAEVRDALPAADEAQFHFCFGLLQNH